MISDEIYFHTMYSDRGVFNDIAGYLVCRRIIGVRFAENGKKKKKRKRVVLCSALPSLPKPHTNVREMFRNSWYSLLSRFGNSRRFRGIFQGLR